MDELSPDALAVILLCADLGLSEPAPLSAAEWHRLAERLDRCGRLPGELLGWEADEFLGLPSTGPRLAARYAALLAQAAAGRRRLEQYRSAGIQPVIELDDAYPPRLRERLGPLTPAVLFVQGERELLGTAALAVTGSRDADEASLAFARDLGRRCGTAGETLVTGGARGVDQAAGEAALMAGGNGVLGLPGNLPRCAREPSHRAALNEGRLTLITPYDPLGEPNAGKMLGRNRLIYALAEHAVVVACREGTGGTWTGATEALESAWLPVFVRTGASAPEGNAALAAAGGLAFDEEELEPVRHPTAWLRRRAARLWTRPQPRSPAETLAERWPELAGFLGEWRTVSDLAQHAGVPRSAAAEWMRIALADGRVIRRERPRGYRLNEQPTLF